MFLLQVAQAPFPVVVANEKGQPQYEVVLPKYTLQDAINFGSVLVEKWRASETKDMTPQQIREYGSMHPAISPTLGDLKRSIAALDGAKDVVSSVFPRGRVFEMDYIGSQWSRGNEITNDSDGLLEKLLERVLSGSSSGTLTELAWKLADLQDTSAVAPPPMPGNSIDDDKDEDEDPLSSTAGGAPKL
jgi:hypothetical protein